MYSLWTPVIEPALDGFRYSGNMYMNTYLHVYIYIYIYVFTHQLCAYVHICALWTLVIEPALDILMASVILVICIWIPICMYIYMYICIYTHIYTYLHIIHVRTYICTHCGHRWLSPRLVCYWLPLFWHSVSEHILIWILHVCTYIYICIRIYTSFIYAHTYVRTWRPVIQPELGILMASVNLAICLPIHVCIYVYIYIYIFMYI